MPPGVRQWNWVLDMHGFRLIDSDPRLARIFLSLAGERYPERLGQFWVVDAPKLFSGLWSIIEKFIDPKTKEKIRFVSTKNGERDLRDALGTHFREDDVEWFCSEVASNRKAKRGEKTFWLPRVCRAVAGRLPRKCGGIEREGFNNVFTGHRAPHWRQDSA